jgi:N-acetylmuramoyl-L-alanine amidase
MQPQPYQTMSDLELTSLCVWREAEGEGLLGKRGVAHTVKNRSDNPSWWGSSVKTVILCKWQYSSFNEGNPRADKWPADNDPNYSDSLTISEDVLVNGDEDITNGADSYYDISIPAPYWANAATSTLTLSVGRFRFFKTRQENR